MFRTKKKKAIPPVTFMGIKFNLYGMPTLEPHAPEELVPLLPKNKQPLTARQKHAFFKDESATNVAQDTFIWQGEKIQGNPEAEKKEDQETFYVLASKNHKSVYKLIREEDFLGFALENINRNLGPPTPQKR